MPIQVETRGLAGRPFRLGDWLVEPALNRLSRGDMTIQLELKVMDVLVCLAERAGEVVTRQEIVDRVWATEFISDNTLTHAITEIRNALGDDAKKPSFIETIHRRGYRLIAPVKPAASDEAGESKVARFPVRERLATLDEERSPYPGLAAFTEADAEFFFGREDEVARMWRKLTSRKLLAVIGPSGVGKSSFLRAGVIPARPEGWGVLVCHPGESPFSALARALVPMFGGDGEAIAKLVGLREVGKTVAMISRWRERHQQALLIVDQFEELLTLNPREVQISFAELLRRVVDEADVHVLLAMRDDFLYRCHDHEPLAPVFDALTPVKAPVADALRRALVEPAGRLGFTFEDDELPREMVTEVEGERGALPLLAFAIARLWDRREHARQLLTRQAYHEIGGVSGALAQHAESTLKTIGDERLPIVREIFRNLVTSEGTRAVREVGELLSVFAESQRTDAEQVLWRLVDSRLLTSFEEQDVEGESRRRVEVVHESLLTSWPRLVRWQTQDADAAQLRDQLRQAAKTWDEHGRTGDMLWTGSAYREYTAWRERYLGGLTELEEAFASAMISLATRRKRRRRIAVAAGFAILLAVLAVVGTLWRRSVLETRRAEAAKLLALAQVQIEKDPTEALAYTTSSLELADTNEARVFAVRALWAGPPVRSLDLLQYSSAQFQFNLFSPDGRWLVVSPIVRENVLVFNDRGGPPIVLGGHAVTASGHIRSEWNPEGFLATGHWTEGRARVWAMPHGRLVREIKFEGNSSWQFVGDRIFSSRSTADAQTGHRIGRLASWDIRDGKQTNLGEIDWTALGVDTRMFDPHGSALVFTRGDGVYSRPLPGRAGAPDRLIAHHTSEGAEVRGWYRGEGLFSTDRGGEIILWTTGDGTSVPGRRLRRPETATTRLFSDESGRWAFEDPSDDNRLRLWDREGLLGANPLVLRRVGWWTLSHTDFHPGGGWVIATTRDRKEVSFWPLLKTLPFVVDSDPPWQAWEFTPDGRYLLTSDVGSTQGDWANQLRLWPLPSSGSAEIVDLKLPADARATFRGVTMSANGEQAISRGFGRAVFVIPLNGNEPRQFEGFSSADVVDAVGFSPSGRLAAAATMITEGQATLRVWDLDTDEMTAFDQPEDPEAYQGYFALDLSFVDETALFTAGANGLLRWDIKAGTSERVLGAPPGGLLKMRMAFDRQSMLVTEIGPSLARTGGAILYDLATGEVRSLEIPGDGLLVALCADGAFWVAGDSNGSIWVGRADGGEPHLLLGHGGEVFPMAISPDNRWIASSSITDKTLRLWPMPDLSEPPLHTLPHDELIAKLKTLTNLRVVRDEESSTGWKVEVGPFPGWETVPTW